QGRGVYSPRGELICLEGFITDITERKQAEDILRHSESRFSSLVGLSSDWYWELDADLRCTRIDGRSVQGNEAAFAEYLGQLPWESGNLVREDGHKIQRGPLAERKAFRDVVLHLRLPNGIRNYVSLSGEPIFDAAGKFVGYRGVARDITKRMRADQLL